MTYRSTRWPYLIQYDPDRARAQVLAAYREAGSAAGAARILGLSIRSLQRAVSQLGIDRALLTRLP